MIDASILLPLRDEERHLDELIESLIHQEYDDLNIEFIFIDGHSRDNTLRLLKEKTKHLPFPSKIISNSNKTTPSSLNLGISHASGKYIIRIDGHSIYPENYIKRLLEIHRNCDCDNVGARVETIPNNKYSIISNSIAGAMSSSFCVGGSRFRTSKTLSRLVQVDSVPFGCYRKSLLDKIGYFDNDLIRNRDDELNARITGEGGKIILDTSLVVKYIARSNFKLLTKMFYQYGVYKPIAAFKAKRIYTFRQLIPMISIFIAVLLACLSFFNINIFYLFSTLSLLYFLIGFTFSTLSYKDNKNKNKSIINYIKYTIGFLISSICIHSSYGFGYIRGIFILFNRKNIAKDLLITR